MAVACPPRDGPRYAGFFANSVVSGNAPIVVFMRGRFTMQFQPGRNCLCHPQQARPPRRVTHADYLAPHGLKGGAMVTEDKKRTAHRALKDRILNGEGTAPRDLRARAFDNAGLPPQLDALLGKVATRPTQVTEADFAAAKASGFSEDQLFELVVCAAVGQSTRLYEAGLAALAEAVASREDR
jgi:hypothetical protein